MRDTIGIVLFVAASVLGVIHGPDRKTPATDASQQHESPEPELSDSTAVSAPGPIEVDENEQNLQVASEIGELKKADLLIGRRLQAAIEETKVQVEEETNARMQLASDVDKKVTYELQGVAIQLANLRAQLNTKANVKDITVLETAINDTRHEHEEHRVLLEKLEAELNAVTTQQQDSEITEKILNDRLLFTFPSTEGDALLFELVSGAIEVEIRAIRYPVIQKSTDEQCRHFRSLKRNIASKNGVLDFGYMQHDHMNGSASAGQFTGYVVFFE